MRLPARPNATRRGIHLAVAQPQRELGALRELRGRRQRRTVGVERAA
jgi:hypothetical protein